MLNGYFDMDESTPERDKRLLAVQAALEIIKASVTPSPVRPAGSLKDAEEHVASLADAIQNALR